MKIIVRGGLTEGLYTAPSTTNALAAPPGVGDIQDGQSFLAAFPFRVSRPAADGCPLRASAVIELNHSHNDELS